MNSPLIQRFRESMIMNQERWHDGTGYDLELLKTATPDERDQLESLLDTKSVSDWRDVEALAFLDTPRSRDRLCAAFASGDVAMKTTILSHAPDLFTDEQRTDVLVSALQSGVNEALSAAMLLVEAYHPPQVVEAIIQGLRTQDVVTADEFAMMLLVIHGKAESLYDLDVRMTLPRFEGPAREQHVRDLCEKAGIKQLPESLC